MAKDNPPKLARKSLPQEVRLSVKACQEKKGEDIVVLDLRQVSTFTDYFVIVTGNSSRQNQAISEAIEQELKKGRLMPLGVEGKDQAEWILIDYGSFIVHVFSRQARGYYSLEKLWGDAPRLSWGGR